MSRSQEIGCGVARRVATSRLRALCVAFCAAATTILLGDAWLLGEAAAEQPTPPPASELRVSPPEIIFRHPEASLQTLVTIHTPAISGQDVRGITRDAEYRVQDPSIAVVDERGRLRPLRDGETVLKVRWKGLQTQATVSVQGIADPQPVSFRHGVLPILTKAGCNSGGCHGKAEGQNGFKLSILGYDAESDHAALVKEGRGRRVSLSAPQQSLLLQKGLAEVPHGGGQKLTPGSAWHRLMRRWIAEGAALDRDASLPIREVIVEPKELTLSAFQARQLRVVAVDIGGDVIDVTAEAEFQSNSDAIASVAPDGLIQTKDAPGEAAILVRYMGHVATCRVTAPLPNASDEFQRPPETNFIDQHVWNKLESMRLEPSPRALDAEFLRRSTLDTIGRLPSVEEAKQFLSDTRSDKRDRWIDGLLKRDEYADYWAMRWADILRVDKAIVAPQGALGMTRWLKNQFAENTPYDQMVREILLARGSVQSESPAAFYQVHDDPEELARAVSQVFLGVRIECAQCHHHPFERWAQRDYFALAGFFTGLQRKKAAGGLKLIAGDGKDLEHPRTETPVSAAGLGAEPAEFAEHQDRRLELAKWMTSADNPFLAKMIANRLWSHYFDRGLVEPIDDLRATNPATNEPLLEALAEHLRRQRFDLKAFTRTLLRSQAYQRASGAHGNNAIDTQHYSHAAWKSLPAEVLLDAICDATEATQSFNGWPEGVRAIEVWDNRMPSYFFQVFGRPQRVSVCECERGDAPSIAQALHLMNAPETVAKIRHRDGRAVRLAASPMTAEQIIDELYLATLSRRPRADETKWMLQAFEARDAVAVADARRQATEDVLWTLLNSREFVFNH